MKLVEPGHSRRSDDAPSWTGHDGILTGKRMGFRDTAGALHELQPNMPRKLFYRVDICHEDRSQISIHHRCLSPPHNLDKRYHFMRNGNLPESRLSLQRRYSLFMCGIFPGVHEDDGNRGNSHPSDAHQISFHLFHIQAADHLSSRINPFLNFFHAAVKLFGFPNLQSENLRSRLIPDFEEIPKPLGDEECYGSSFSFQEGVGGNGGAHANSGYSLFGN